MRRRSVHAFFAAAAAALALAAAWQGWRAWQAERINADIAVAERMAPAVRAAAAGDGSASAASIADTSASAAAGGGTGDAPRRHPQLRIARALALHAGGESEAAIAALQAIAVGSSGDAALATQTLYDAGTLALMQAMPLLASSDAARAQPLLVQAKQRLRQALRLTPDDWDARYNLERALQWAPEGEVPPAAEEPTNVEKRRAPVRGFGDVELP